MSVSSRLTEVFKASKEIAFNDSSKFIFFSDCHRGDNSWADTFARNQNLFSAALTHYYKEGFTYIEIGDGDELWGNRNFSVIRQAHSDVFCLMRKFYLDGRFYMLLGNHDIVKKNTKFVQNNLFRSYNSRIRNPQTLFDKIECLEGLILRYQNGENKLFVVHGHQGDLFNERLWRISRFLFRFFWRPLEIIGFNNITSPARNYKRRETVESEISNWSKSNHQVIIAGHTHRPMFPDAGQTQYFNDGCCIHPRCITGIEIRNGEILLIKWSVKTKVDGALYVERDVISGPRSIKSLF
jgi:UDP-2,3-diacylglucosamine pyrophosphatase LpxH